MTSNIQLKVFCQKQLCNLIIDNESCENIISNALMDYLKLETESYPQPTKVINLCHVSISIGKLCQDYVAFEVVNMDKCHNLLGRPWQYDVDATHRGKENI